MKPLVPMCQYTRNVIQTQFHFFRSSLFAIISKYLWGVLNLYTLRTVAIHVDSAEGFLKVLKVASCVVVILWPSTHEYQIS